MKYFTINSFVESLKESYPTMTRLVLIFNTKSLNDTPYHSKQGMPCIRKVFDEEDTVLKFDDIITLFDEDFQVSFKMPLSFKENYAAVDIDCTPVFNERIDAMYYNRQVRKLGGKTIKLAIEEYKKQMPHITQSLEGEPFDL